MGRDSEYYKSKKKDQKLKLRDLMKLLPEFALDYIHDKEISAQTSTLISYAYDLLTFFRYLKNSNPYFRNLEIKALKLEDVALLTSEDIVEYQRYLELNINGEKHENGKKSIARKMAPLRGLFQYHFEHEYIEKNPMALVKLPNIKKDKNIIRMNQAEISLLLQSIEHGAATMSERQKKYCLRTKQRDLAVLTLMLGTGIRVSECAGLDINDLNFTDNSFVIVRKGGGQDVLYFSKEIQTVLEDYLEGERTGIIPLEGHEKALFLSLQSKRISIDAIENLVKKYARAVIPNKKITPHKLRSTYGTALYRQTGDIRLVADVLGHENVNTTIDYYAAIEDEHKKRAANAVTLRGDSSSQENSSN